MNAPKLRFPGFEGEWVEKRLGDCATFFSGGTPTSTNKAYYQGDIPFIKSGEINNSVTEQFLSLSGLSNSSAKMVAKGDLLFALYGATSGEVSISKIEGAINQAVLCIRSKQIDVEIMLYIFQRNKTAILERYLQGGQGNLSAEIIKNLLLSLPSLLEQQKIAEFLSSVDNVIQLLTKKKTLLENYKKGIMQKIFSQEIRFKDENGNDFPEWEEKRLFDVSERIKRKNDQNCDRILTISARSGLVSQEDFFNSRVASRDLSGYYLLAKDDFAYNKSYSNGYPMGAIKRLKLYDKGVVSSLYICFRFNQHVLTDFMEQYFEAGLLNYGIESVAQEGARNHGLLNISIDDFFGILLLIPPLPEQQKIADFLSGIDRSIEIVNSQIEKAKEYKKGLLQKMFV